MKILILFPTVLLCGACARSTPGTAIPKSEVERKMIGLLEKFDRWDDDGDGELDQKEIAAGLKGTDHQPANVIDFYDTSGNLKISLKEAQSGYRRASEAENLIRIRNAGGTR
jgi:hypothetical protein